MFLVSLVPVIFHKKLPVLKKFTSKKARVLWGVGFIFIPANIAGGLIGRSATAEATTSYQLNLMDFRQYRQNKDITQINPDIKLAEF